MTIPAGRLEALLEQINGGRAAHALPEIDGLLLEQPGHPAALALKAEALRLTQRTPEAIVAYRQAGERGAGTRSWLLAGILLAAERNTDEAVQCLQRALAESPDSDAVLDSLVTTLFNANRFAEAVEFARRQLLIGTNPRYMCNAALLLQSSGLYEESAEALKKIVALAPDDPTVVGAALGPARFTCEWEWIETLQRKIGGWYDRGDFAAPNDAHPPAIAVHVVAKSKPVQIRLTVGEKPTALRLHVGQTLDLALAHEGVVPGVVVLALKDVDVRSLLAVGDR